MKLIDRFEAARRRRARLPAQQPHAELNALNMRARWRRWRRPTSASASWSHRYGLETFARRQEAIIDYVDAGRPRPARGDPRRQLVRARSITTTTASTT